MLHGHARTLCICLQTILVASSGLYLPCFPHSTELCPDIYPDHDCRPSHGKTVEDPPLLFDLHRDPSEVYTLTPDDPEYNQTMSIISKVMFMKFYCSHNNDYIC